ALRVADPRRYSFMRAGVQAGTRPLQLSRRSLAPEFAAVSDKGLRFSVFAAALFAAAVRAGGCPLRKRSAQGGGRGVARSVGAAAGAVGCRPRWSMRVSAILTTTKRGAASTCPAKQA